MLIQLLALFWWKIITKQEFDPEHNFSWGALWDTDMSDSLPVWVGERPVKAPQSPVMMRTVKMRGCVGAFKGCWGFLLRPARCWSLCADTSLSEFHWKLACSAWSPLSCLMTEMSSYWPRPGGHVISITQGLLFLLWGMSPRSSSRLTTRYWMHEAQQRPMIMQGRGDNDFLSRVNGRRGE